MTTGPDAAPVGVAPRFKAAFLHVFGRPIVTAWRTYTRGRWPYVIPALVVVFVAVWIAEWVVLLRWGLETYQSIFTYHPSSAWWALFTSLFAHTGPGPSHLAWNTVGVVLLGVPLVRWMSTGPALALLVAGGAIAAFLQGLFVPNQAGGSVGASGGLTAWIGAAAMLWRLHQSPRVSFWPQAAPALVFVAFLVEAMMIPAQLRGEQVGHFAHVLGVVIGMAVGLGYRAVHGKRARRGGPEGTTVGD